MPTLINHSWYITGMYVSICMYMWHSAYIMKTSWHFTLWKIFNKQLIKYIEYIPSQVLLEIRILTINIFSNSAADLENIKMQYKFNCFVTFFNWI